MKCEAPATRVDLEAIVAEARRVAPLSVPEDTADKFATAGATPTQARAKLFEMVWGQIDLTSDRPIAARLIGERA